ncbi:MAG: sensor domain-containing protein, partial [Gaiellaceae bacterium]
MSFVYRPFVEPRTYRRLLFLLTAVPLAPVWFALLLAGWLLVGLTAITPAVIPVLMAFRSLTWLAARVEAALAHALLDVDARPSQPVTQAGYVGRIRSVLADPGLWRQQTYLALRTLGGGAFAIATLSALAAVLGLLAMPITYRFGGGANIGSWQIDTLPRALLFVPAGLVALGVWAQLVRLASAPWPRLARGFIGETGAEMPTIDQKRALAIHAALTAAVGVLLVVVWALTGSAYFWPIWALLPLGLVLATRAW